MGQEKDLLSDQKIGSGGGTTSGLVSKTMFGDSPARLGGGTAQYQVVVSPNIRRWYCPYTVSQTLSGDGTAKLGIGTARLGSGIA